MIHKRTNRLETSRLILRPFQIEDAPDMYHNWAKDPEVTRYLTWTAHPSLEATKQLLQLWVDGYKSPEQYQWAIEERRSGRVIGSISLLHNPIYLSLEEMELGYVLGKDWWNRGLMTEAARRILTYGFEELELHRIKAVHHIDNPASGRVMEKAGMTFEGTIREEHRDNQKNWCTIRQYAALCTDPPLWRQDKKEVGDR